MHIIEPMKNDRQKIKSSADDKSYDFDLQALKDNLKLTPYQRIQKHQAALELFDKLRNSKKL